MQKLIECLLVLLLILSGAWLTERTGYATYFLATLFVVAFWGMWAIIMKAHSTEE